METLQGAVRMRSGATTAPPLTPAQAIRDRHAAAADKIWKHKRNRNTLPLSIQGFRDWKRDARVEEIDGAAERRKSAALTTASAR